MCCPTPCISPFPSPNRCEYPYMRAPIIAAHLVAAALLFLSAAPVADAWWCMGHMTIAQIAKNTMSQVAASRVNAIIADLSRAGPFPQSPDMVQVSCWADDIKEDKLSSMNGWHFVDKIYNPTNYPIGPTTGLVPDENVAHVISQLDSTAAVNAPVANKKQWVLQFAVAMLIHFYGDIHQPLHTIQLFSEQYPKGDRGGNEEKLVVDGTDTTLHFIWDSVCWTQHNDLPRPLSAADNKTLVDYAARLMRDYSFPTEKVHERNSTIMATESYEDAIKYAYPGITNGMTVPQSYLNRCIPVAEARIALAGYRLGALLEELFGVAVKDFDYRSNDDGTISDAASVLAKRIHRHLAEIIVARQVSVNQMKKGLATRKTSELGSRFQALLASLRG